MESIPGYADYPKREYCRAVECPVQVKLNREIEGSPAYEALRKTCSTACVHTTHEFHKWLIEQGYLVVKPR